MPARLSIQWGRLRVLSLRIAEIVAQVQCSTPAGIEVGVELHCLASGSQVAALHTPGRCHLQTPQLHVELHCLA